MINTEYFLALTLVIIRLASFFVIVKAFYPKGTPNQLKAFFALIFGVAIMGGIDYTQVGEISNNYMLAMYVISEVFTGIILGIITNIIFDIVMMAGSLMDVHIGLSMVSVLDPTAQNNSTLISNLLHYVAMVIFFVLDGHHILLKSLIESYKLLPFGENIFNQDTMMYLIEVVAKFFAIGMKIAMPMVLIIILTDLCMGLVSRAVPQINVMVLGMPVKILVGLFTLTIALPILIKVFISAASNLPDIFREILSIAPVAIVFASDEKTEEATPKKKQDARKKGQIARSKDVSLALSMVVCLLVIIGLSGMLVSNLRDGVIYFLQDAALMEINEASLSSLSVLVISKFAATVLPIIVPIMVAGIVANIMQTGFLLTGEPLKPSFGKLNPIKGFKNMFSKKSFIDLIKNLTVVTIVIFLGYSYIKDNFNDILQVSNIYLPSLGLEVKNLIVGIFTKVAILMVVLAAIDYFIQFKLHNSELKMTKQETKEEYKQMEGDPQIKSKIKQKQREMSQRRMMQSIGDATVVVTNPTHIAVAIKYTEGEMEAPRVVAKGADALALKIKEKAKEHDVPIIENKPLARLIYSEVEVDGEIPQDMYQAVAEILAMVLKLKK